MRTIHKFKLATTGEIQEFHLPLGSAILKFGEQNGQVVMWVDVRTENNTYVKHLQIIGTGHDIGEYPSLWLDTVQMSNGLVWHIYEI